MVELVYTLAQGASAKACGFESHYRHYGDLAAALKTADREISVPGFKSQILRLHKKNAAIVLADVA